MYSPFFKTYLPNEQIPENTLLPTQTHSNNIACIVTGNEDIKNTDGIFATYDDAQNFKKYLGIKHADCGAICVWDEKKFGCIHAWWRGCVNGIIEDMLLLFPKGNIWVSAIYDAFEIQHDSCYDTLQNKFGRKFFCQIGSNTSIFLFRACLSNLLPENTQFDERNTFETSELASWRRDKEKGSEYTWIRNTTLIGVEPFPNIPDSDSEEKVQTEVT